MKSTFSPIFFRLTALAVAPVAVFGLLPSGARAQSLAQSPAPVTAQPQNEPLSLARAIELGLQLQPTIAVAVANRQASQQRLLQAQSRYFPSVTPSFNYQNQYTFGNVPVFLPGGIVTTLPSGRTTENRQEQVAASIRLWDSGTRDLNARQSRQTVRGQTYSEENTRQTVIGNIADTYFNALRTDALVQVSEAQVARAQNALDLIRAQVENEVAARKDIFQAEADLLNAQVSLLQARNNSDIAYTQLRNAIGLPGAGKIPLIPFAPPTPDRPTTADLRGVNLRAADSDSVQTLVKTAVDVRPDIAQIRNNVDVSKTTVAIARINTLPLITADFATAYQFNNAESLLTSVANNRQFLFSVSYPLFDAGNARANVRASQASQRAAEAQVVSQEQQVALEVEQAWRTLLQARATLPASIAAQTAAQINYDAALASRKEGVGTAVEVITAQTQLTQAQTNYVQAIYNFYSADARLARVLGQADRIAATTGGAPSQGTPVPAPAVPVPSTLVPGGAAR